MRRLPTILLATTCLAAALATTLLRHAVAIPADATLESITVPDPSVSQEILLRIAGNYSFKTIRTPEGALCVDLVGVRVGSLAWSADWSAGRFAGYQLASFADARGEPEVRVEILTRGPEALMAERQSSGLALRVYQGPAVSSLSTPPAPVAESSDGNTGAGLVSDVLSLSTPPTPVADSSDGNTGAGLVSDVLIKPAATGEVSIDVATTKAVPFHVFQLNDPARLVLDLDGVRNAVRRRAIPVSSPLLTDVRVGQFRDDDSQVVRVVADLSGRPTFDVHAYEGGVRMELKPRSTVVFPAVALAPQAARETAAKHDDRKPDYTIVLPGGADVAGINLASAALKGGETPLQAATPESLRAEKAARVLSSRSASTSTSAQVAMPPVSAQDSEENQVYSGEPISLNLKDVDLKDFFRLIHEISGLNILVDPNVTGSVTTVLDNVPWDQALDIVLKDNNLGKVLEGNVLRIARLDTLMAEQETANRMAAARLDAAPLETIFRPLNYAKAPAIAALLRQWSAGKEGGGALSPRGSVLVDERTNTLIISDIIRQIPMIQQVLDKLDSKTKQVAIEARIVLATSSFQRTLSAALVGALANTSGSTIGAGQTGSSASITPSSSAPPTFTIPSNAASGFGVVAITNFSERYLIDAAISAAEIRSQAKTISRPSIITQNNAEGMVQQGTQIPVQTSINNTISVQYVNATLRLTVTPQITEDGHIFLNIRVQNASPGSIITNAAVSINIQESTTQVLVPDGGTVVFGGVTVTQRQNSSTGVPLLGDIPILGHLFKTTNVQDSDQELLFFVSPRLLTS